MAQSSTNRKSLESKLSSIEKALDEEVTDLSETVKTGARAALIIGGIVAGGYLLYSLFGGDDEPENQKEKAEKEEEEEGEKSLTGMIASIGMAIALEAGKDWLEGYLDKE